MIRLFPLVVHRPLGAIHLSMCCKSRVPNCTKDKAKNPLGVCSIYHENEPVITCPIRFRQDWIITDHAPSFFFVALNRTFFATLPPLKQVPKGEADIGWFIYDLKLHAEEGQGPGRYRLTKVDEVFTEFEPALLSITTPLPGGMEDFIKLLQEKLDEQLESPPTNQTIERPF